MGELNSFHLRLKRTSRYSISMSSLNSITTNSPSTRSSFLPLRKPAFPGSLTDLHRFRKTAHGHDGSSRIVMVRKTDQRTFASMQDGQEPKFETITRETIETFRGQKTECKVTTEKKDFEDSCPQDILDALNEKVAAKTVSSKPKPSPNKLRINKRMDFQSECLKAHNDYRRKHGVPPLKLDRNMCRVSQEWADYLIKKGALSHSKNREYGENLFMMQSSNPNFTVSGKEAVDSWYEEIKFHIFGTEPNSLSSGHFTQVVWKESRQLGVAFAKNGGKVVVVANYFPPDNVLPPGSYDEAPSESPITPKSPRVVNYNNNHIDLPHEMSRLSFSSRSSLRDVSKSFTEGPFEEDFLEAHNNYRLRHGVPPLKLDKKLCKYAEEWAKHLAARNTLEHRPESNYGENIYCLYSSDPNFSLNGHTPVDQWYEEIKEHPFGREPSNLKSGHFSQVIWKESEQLGVGVAKNSHGSIYVVANYFPAGNFVGHYVDNCPPVKPTFYNTIGSGSVRVDNKEPNHFHKARDYKYEPAASAKSPTGEINVDEFALEALKIHNEYRRRHGVPDLKLTKELCDFAQDWAETCARTTSLQHRANNPYGENIFSMYSSDHSHIPTARDTVMEWYNEVKKHSFGKERVIQGSLHFTQVIWKSSTELGVGIAKNRKGQTYVVCNYNPRGNYIGQFCDNVPPPKS